MIGSQASIIKKQNKTIGSLVDRVSVATAAAVVVAVVVCCYPLAAVQLLLFACAVGACCRFLASIARFVANCP